MKFSIRLTVLGLICCLVSACAAMPESKVVDKHFLSEVPPLDIEFAYEIHVVEENGRSKEFIFNSNEIRPVVVEIVRLTLTPRRVDYYYSLETIASNHQFYYMGAKYLAGHKWAKVEKLNDNGWLICGYMTRKDQWLIFIHNYRKLPADGIKSYEMYKKTLKPSEGDLAYFNQKFDDLNKSTTIIH